MKEMIKQLITGQREPSDIWHYIVGNYRHRLYYAVSGNKPDFMRQHIWEQIKYRIRVMNPSCYNSGSCIKCGCQTTQLQMSDKACEGNCYPAMMNTEKWRRYKTGSVHVDNQQRVWIYIKSQDKHILYEETMYYVPKENISNR